MKISTRGRYALRFLLDLAEHACDGFTPMKIVAERQGISLKYLEQLVPILGRNGLIEGQHGKGGGYRLLVAPSDVTVGSVLRMTEGELVPVACLECGSKPCERAEICLTLPMWKACQQLMNSFFDGITLDNLLHGNIRILLADSQGQEGASGQESA